jgi:acyl-coenzyme A synthetase/AMP-(fatty) acid ligase
MEDNTAPSTALFDAADRPLLCGREGAVGLHPFLARAAALAERLPERRAAINLCERRDHFLLTFAALLLRRQVCLLPPARNEAVVGEVSSQHAGSYVLDDAQVARARLDGPSAQLPVPFIPPRQVVVIGYTSGSTGQPKPNPKTWGGFQASTAINARRLREVLAVRHGTALPWIVATVPPQHMYGLETSVLLPLLGGMAVHAGQPLFPADVAAALRECPQPRVLVSTPVHLRALLESGVTLPELGAIVSATAPLPANLALQLEKRFGTVLLEFFGSTETCVIASRHTARQADWTAYPGLSFQPGAEGTLVDAPWFDSPVLLQDILELRPGNGFVVRGRNADMVEVAGKRASLADLTRRMIAIPGVRDAAIFQPDDQDDAHARRLAALVVADDVTEAQLAAAFAALVDPVFVPRPILLVPALPRNEVGKLPRAQLLAALKR